MQTQMRSCYEMKAPIDKQLGPRRCFELSFVLHLSCRQRCWSLAVSRTVDYLLKLIKKLLVYASTHMTPLVALQFPLHYPLVPSSSNSSVPTWNVPVGRTPRQKLRLDVITVSMKALHPGHVRIALVHHESCCLATRVVRGASWAAWAVPR
jgi:hypothetical protein